MKNGKESTNSPTNKPAHSSDFIGDLLVRGKSAAFPRSFREKYGSTEPMFASACGLEFLHGMLSTLKTIHAGVSAIQRQTSLASIFSREVRPGGPTHKLARDILKASADDVEQAKLVLESDFDSINSLAAVAMVTVYEVSTEDTLKSLLRFSPGLVLKMQSLGVPTANLPVDRDLTYSEASLGVKKLKDWCRSQNKQVPEGDILAFNSLDVPINPSAQTRSSIRELWYVRNCIVHRGKRADSKCKDEANRLNLVDGEIFSVRRSDMGTYTEALFSFLTEIFELLNKSSLASAAKAQSDPT